jgi:sec-independent protein translocase protein TatA
LLSKDKGYRAIASGRVRFMGTQELFIVAIILLVLFGGSQLPKLAKNLGSAQRELKKAMEEGKGEGDSSESK